jgi:hypothetical protein
MYRRNVRLQQIIHSTFYPDLYLQFCQKGMEIEMLRPDEQIQLFIVRLGNISGSEYIL